jgi:hypothetical protein
MGRLLIGKYDLLGFAVPLTRGRSVNKSCHQQQEQGCAEKGNPKMGIVHVKSSQQYKPKVASVPLFGRRSFIKGRVHNVAFNTTGSVDSGASDPASGNGVPERGLSWSNYPHRNRVPERLPGIVNAMDRPLLYILIALSVTLLLFAVGVFPYPFGLIVLILLALGRFLQIRGPA